MLQDAIFASQAWLAKTGNEDVAVKFLRASYKGWQYCRDNPARLRGHRPEVRRQAAQGPPDLAAQRDQRPDLAVPERASGRSTRRPGIGRSRSPWTARSSPRPPTTRPSGRISTRRPSRTSAATRPAPTGRRRRSRSPRAASRSQIGRRAFGSGNRHGSRGPARRAGPLSWPGTVHPRRLPLILAPALVSATRRRAALPAGPCGSGAAT